jgi:hypothetical protein
MTPSHERPGRCERSRPSKSSFAFQAERVGNSLKTAEFQAKSLLVDDEYLRRLCAHLHRLGKRSVYEFVREIIDGADPVDRLAAYSRLDPAVLAYLGGDRLPVTEVRQ